MKRPLALQATGVQDMTGTQDVNHYAAPKHDLPLNALPEEPRGGIWRDGDLLVMRNGAVLPDRCVRCNAPAAGRIKCSFQWFDSRRFPFFRTARVELGLCRLHRRWFYIAASTVVLLLIFTIGWAIAGSVVCKYPRGGPNSLDWGAYVMLSGIFWAVGVVSYSATIYAAFCALPIAERKIDRDYVWLKKVDPEYLAQFPPVADDVGGPPPC